MEHLRAAKSVLAWIDSAQRIDRRANRLPGQNRNCKHVNQRRALNQNNDSAARLSLCCYIAVCGSTSCARTLVAALGFNPPAGPSIALP